MQQKKLAVNAKNGAAIPFPYFPYAPNKSNNLCET
jgi:hypothetical protein